MHTTVDVTGRDRITHAAAGLFVERGYAQTSLRDIAGAVGIKAGSIYYHFDSKEDLYVAVLQQGIRVMEDAFTRIAAEVQAADGATRVRRHIHGHLSALFEHGPYTTNHVSAFHIAPADVKKAVIPARDRYERAWVEMFEDLTARGEMTADLSPALSRLALFGAMNFAVEWFDPRRGNLDELATVIARQFWHGVAT